MSYGVVFDFLDIIIARIIMAISNCGQPLSRMNIRPSKNGGKNDRLIIPYEVVYDRDCLDILPIT